MKITTPTSRVRTSFDPEFELPKLHQWFAENPHPSRLTLQTYVKELNGLASRQSRKLLEVHNLCYWFKNARAAYKRAELRMKKNHEYHGGPPDQMRVASLDNSSSTSSSVSTPAPLSVPITNGQNLKSFSQSIAHGKGLASIKCSPHPTQYFMKKIHYPRTQLMTITDEPKGAASDGDMHCRVKIGSQGKRLDQSTGELAYANQFVGLDANMSSNDVSPESPSRTGSTSPSSTVATSGVVSQQGLSNIDLANAVNCLLNTATNFTAAAAAAAAAASSTLNTGSLPTSNLLQGPSSAAINLAATLLNSNFIKAGGQLGDPSLLAAAMNGRATIANPASALVDQPIRQLFTAFNPSNYQIALGILDEKVLDSNILNAMTFPTSACASNVALPCHIPLGHQHDSSGGVSNIKHYLHNHHNHHRTRLNGSRANGL